jgi:hypothetical protein
MMPVLPDLALAPLRAMDEAGLTHLGERRTIVSVRQPGGTYTTTPVWLSAVPVRYNPISLDAPLRADQPSGAKRGTLSAKSGTQLVPGDQWRITGTTNGEAWTRVVSITEVLFPRSHELRRRALVTDVASNP